MKRSSRRVKFKQEEPNLKTYKPRLAKKVWYLWPQGITTDVKDNVQAVYSTHDLSASHLYN